MESQKNSEPHPDTTTYPDSESYAGTDGSTDGGGADMDQPFIVLRDKTTHGGIVITASENTFTDDRRVARIGDLVSCPIPGHGVNPIVTASTYVEIDGRRVARHHDLTACGSLLLSSQFESSSE